MTKTINAILALLLWVSVLLQLILMIENRTQAIGETVARFFSFFTILTNSLAAFYFTGQFFGSRITAKPGTLTAVTVYILIVCLVYQFLLRHLWQPKGLQWVVDELLHTVNPVLVLLYWFRYEKKSQLAYRMISSWLIYPVAYLAFVLVRGNLSGFYPYPFIDVKKIGITQVMFNSAALLLFFVLISFAFIGLSRAKAKTSRVTI